MAGKISKLDQAGILTPSLLDRLLDSAPRVQFETPLSPKDSRQILLSGLRRDIENLLNTRRVSEATTEGLREVKRSVFNYGLPDITDLAANYLHDPQSLARSIEETVNFFESRLTSVSVSVLPFPGGSRALRLVIEGLLEIDPAPEKVIFDGSLELSSGEYQIVGERDAR